ncbi:DUF6323 family protein [Acetanaerobacterium elongatum]|uniref:Uncharacterized protein n=1 Tax=Acetanaerobacterium elongatum TaxID=258515 RepID=A0A1G9UQD8_9FIRM|nr:DUF6323 family protein [Acetanaerobacterium elongatum]SDM62139.1 hypothetical protein SAMN05192585_10290 [Acetanaerobacterium elongatum]
MEDEFVFLPMQIFTQVEASEIVAYNAKTARYGLTLTPEQATELTQTRSRSLAATGRVEFSGGIIGKLIEAFADSPYLQQREYAKTLNELVEAFYNYKNETLDTLSDDELIALMKDYYNRRSGGSLELLTGRELEKLARGIRFEGLTMEEESDEQDGEDDYGYWGWYKFER